MGWDGQEEYFFKNSSRKVPYLEKAEQTKTTTKKKE